MATIKHSGKCIVAAGLMSVGFSLPLYGESVDDMFAALQSANSEEAARIQERIISDWAKSGSPSVDLLLQRGEEAIDNGNLPAAVEHLTAAIDHAPQFAAAYNARATAYYLQGYYGPALDDIRQTLVLNPRHFYAMAGFAVMLEEFGRQEEALELYRQIDSIHPHLPEVDSSIVRLDLLLGGEPL